MRAKPRARQVMYGWMMLGGAMIVGLLAMPARASDGVFEINQTCAIAGGCVPGDLPGFPVSLTQPGSYRLTSDLEPAGADGLEIATLSSEIDLAGFAIRGPGDCDGSGGAFVVCTGNAGSGVTVALGLGDEVAARLHGGSILGMSLGVSFFLVNSGTIEDLLVSECGGIGISFGSGRIANVVVRRNGGDGISLAGILNDFVLEGSNVSQNGGDGVEAQGTSGLIRGSTFSDNAGWGLKSEFIGLPSERPAFIGNAFSGNDLGSTRGGTALGDNYCSPACP